MLIREDHGLVAMLMVERPRGMALRKPFGAVEPGQAIQHVLHAAPPGTIVAAVAQAGSDGPGR